MRMLLVTHFFPAHGGGLERVALELARQFAARDVHITWISSDTDAAPQGLGANVDCIAVRTSNFIEQRTQLPYPLWSPASLALLWRRIGAADAVHVHEHLYACSIVAVLLARLRARPVIITQHMGALRLRSRFGTLLYSVGARLLGLLMFRLAHGAVFISANVRRFFGLENAARAALIFNGVNLERFTPVADDKAQLRRRLGLPDRPVVLFVGRLVRKKGLHIVEALARRIPEAHWLVVGSGPEAPAPSPHGNLTLAGRIPNDRLPDFYRAVDLLILPSSGEGFPLVVQEAMCCGTGILSSEEVASACPPVTPHIRVGPAAAGATEEDGWEQAARETLGDLAYLCDTARRAAVARGLWSWTDCAARYLEWFTALVQAGRKRHE